MNTTLTTPTRFIGRSQEIEEISALLADPACRLLTLVGPGGIGKTRLAMEVAAQEEYAFPDGIYIVQLAPITRPEDILTAVAEAMPFCFQQNNRDQREQFFAYLRENHARRLLLVLDNFEHLLEGVGIISEMLDATTNMKILSTSREALNLQEEWVRQIPGLAYPDPRENRALEEYGAVQLFLDRARRIRGDFDLTEDSEGVVEICRLVEGMPLAIELAAGWLKTLQPADIAHEIQHGVDILATRLRNLPERHRSIRSVFDHSWLMLTENERELFPVLTVFRGGFTREAAEVVANASLNTLAGLVDKSLVRSGANGRYDIHELLRQYGAEQLEATGRTEAVHLAYSEYYLDMLSRLEGDIKGHRQIAALDAVAADFENIRNAWKMAVERAEFEPQALDALNGAVESLSFYGDMRGRYHEVVGLLRAASEHFPQSANEHQAYVRCRVEARLIRLIILGNMRIEFDLHSRIGACLARASEHNDQAEIAFCLLTSGIVTVWMQNDRPFEVPTAVEFFQQSYNIYEELDDRFYMADVLAWGGCPPGFEQSEHIEERVLNRSLELRRQIGDRNGIAWITLNLAEGKISKLDYSGYERYARESLALMREIGSVKGILQAMYKVAQCAVLKGELEEARQLAEELSDLASEANNLDGKTVSYALLAFLACIMDEAYEEGAALALQSYSLSLEPFYDGHNSLAIRWGEIVADCGLGRYEAVRAKYPLLFWGPWRDPGSGTLCLVLEAILLAHEKQNEEAAELLGIAYSQSPYVNGWLDQWGLLSRVRHDLETALGEDEFKAALERGGRRELRTAVRILVGANEGPLRTPSNNGLAEPLSERELEVLALIAGGLSNSDIAERLVLTVGTVKTHARNIFGKLNVKSRTQAVAEATRYNLLS